MEIHERSDGKTQKSFNNILKNSDFKVIQVHGGKKCLGEQMPLPQAGWDEEGASGDEVQA